jgi:hypothetical protein
MPSEVFREIFPDYAETANQSWHWWLMSVILATRKAKIERIVVQG